MTITLETVGLRAGLRLPTTKRNPASCYVLPQLDDVKVPRVPQYQSFSSQGWAKVSYDDPNDELYTCAKALMQAGKAFFDLPREQKHKYQTQHKSEEGWACIEGEKEFVTVRKLDTTPEEIRSAAVAYWAQAGHFLSEVLGCIARSLKLPEEALRVYSDPCMELGDETCATMMRLFKYEGASGKRPKIVAEEHKDIGLLTLVFSDTPGLEVLDTASQAEIALEKSYGAPAASILVGCELERLSNQRYCGGRHLVRSYPRPGVGQEESCRYSIVFALRAHSSVPIDTEKLTTEVTGPFERPLRGVVANDLFRSIEQTHVNINAEIQIREQQRQKLGGASV